MHPNWTLSDPQITITGTNFNISQKLEAFNVTEGMAIYQTKASFVYTNLTIQISVKAGLLDQVIQSYAQTTIDILPLLPYYKCNTETTTQASFYGSCQPKSCQTYLTRISNDIATVPLNTQGSIQATNGSITINIQFKDNQTDGTFARDNNNSCIQSTLIRTNIAYVSLGLNEFPIQSTYNSSTGFRIWSFTLQSNQYSQINNQGIDQITKLLQYQGYFAYQFAAENFTLYTYYFTFKFAINSTTGASSGAQFLQTTTYQQLPCGKKDVCVTFIPATIGFTNSLSTSGCSNATQNTTFYLNANIFICYSIPQYSDWTLSNPIIQFSGEGLLKNIDIKASNVSKGLAVYQVSVEFTYSNVTISVSATAIAPTSRLLDAHQARLLSIGTPSTASKTIGCILASQNATSCPTKAKLDI